MLRLTLERLFQTPTLTRGLRCSQPPASASVLLATCVARPSIRYPSSLHLISRQKAHDGCREATAIGRVFSDNSDKVLIASQLTSYDGFGRVPVSGSRPCNSHGFASTSSRSL